MLPSPTLSSPGESGSTMQGTLWKWTNYLSGKGRGFVLSLKLTKSLFFQVGSHAGLSWMQAASRISSLQMKCTWARGALSKSPPVTF